MLFSCLISYVSEAQFIFIFSGLEEPKPYDIVDADRYYVRSPISLLFWLIFGFGMSEEMRHHQI
mgnify:CR=1 FL=1